MSECKINSWSSSNPNKPCPTCFFNKIEITRLKERIKLIEDAIKSTLDYIEGEHSGPCDTLGVCSNCSIRFELDTVMEAARSGDERS